jgi:hypothetical protein
MNAASKWCNALYWLGLSCWMAALTTAVIAAMNLFTKLPKMGVTLSDFAQYPQDQHGRLAAGLVMSDVFFTVDLIQFVAVPLTTICLLIQLLALGVAVRRPANGLRTVCVVVAALLFGFYALRMAPSLNAQLVQYWSAAAAGQLEQAESIRSVFMDQHRAAENILRINFVLVLIAIVASAVAQAPTATSPSLESPKLLRRK